MQSKSGSRSGVLQWVVVLVVGVARRDCRARAEPDSAPERRAEGPGRGQAGLRRRADRRRAGRHRHHLRGRRHGGPDHDPAGRRRSRGAEADRLRLAEDRALAGRRSSPRCRRTSRTRRRSSQTIPLSSVTAELPGLLAFLEKTLNVSQAQLLAALKTSFPALAQAITNLPTVTSGWDHIQNIDGLTRFDGTPVQTVPRAEDVLQLRSDPRPRDPAEQLREPRRDLVRQLGRAAPADRRAGRDRVRGR